MTKLTREDVERIVKQAPGGKSELPKLDKIDLSHLDLSKVDFNFANLSETNLTESNLSGANLTGVDCIAADLSKANLSDAKLTGAILSGTYLVEADLSNADLTTANLLGSVLIEANFYGADLYKADLSLSALAGANFAEAKLSWTDFTGTVLDEANFNNAQVRGTIFGDVDLREARGLGSVKHLGPSSIDTRTLIHSKGDIPEIFLRGCGLSDLQIEMAKLHKPDLSSKEISIIIRKIQEFFPIQYYSCFISYSSQDEAFVQRLHADLQQKGVRCWFAPEDMKIGSKIRQTIDQSIQVHDKMLLVLSEYSVTSAWVEHEVEHALELEQEKDKMTLFPIRLDDTIMRSRKGWTGNIRRTRQIGDFRQWKNKEAYQRAFERLLRDLKAEE